MFDPSGTYAEERCTPAEPDFEVWDVGHAALAAAAAHLDIDTADLLYARVDVIGGAARSARCWNSSSSSRRWAGGNSTTTTADAGSAEFALGVESALERLGLGPFSHRRP